MQIYIQSWGTKISILPNFYFLDKRYKPISFFFHIQIDLTLAINIWSFGQINNMRVEIKILILIHSKFKMLIVKFKTDMVFDLFMLLIHSKFGLVMLGYKINLYVCFTRYFLIGVRIKILQFTMFWKKMGECHLIDGYPLQCLKNGWR